MTISTKLKPYMAFSGLAGSEEGAGLVFAHSSKEAKKIAWRYFWAELFGEYIEVRVRLLKDANHLYKEANVHKMLEGIPHALYPEGCTQCGTWGEELVDDRCQNCRDNDLDKYGGK